VTGAVQMCAAASSPDQTMVRSGADREITPWAMCATVLAPKKMAGD
jgi:hypothetical protein